MRLRTTVGFAAALLAVVAAARADLRVEAVVEPAELHVGQPTLLEIEVEGSDTPSPPDLSSLRPNFSVEEAGGSANNSQSISIVNGRLSRVVRQGYIFRYRVSPTREGLLTIPSLTIQAGKELARTDPIQVRVNPPRELDDFKLRASLLKDRLYVGEPTVLRTTWYVGGNVDQFSVRMPLLDDPRFEFINSQSPIDPSRRDEYVDIPIAGKTVRAEKGRGRLDGVEYLTVSFDKALVPRQAGEFELPASIVAFRALRAGRRARGLFEDFFGDGSFSGRRAYETYAVPSNRPRLVVLPLPAKGRPPNFSGLIGEFEFHAAAAPTEVRVGDPITLRITASGPAYLEHVRLPEAALTEALEADFKISEGSLDGEVRSGVKVFTRTLRARGADVREIPSVTWNYFSPARGEYQTASTEPIALRVASARLITAADAEGPGAAGAAGSEPASSLAGIAHNYERPAALKGRRGGLLERLAAPLWLAVLLAPPIVFALLGAVAAASRKRDGVAADAATRDALRRLSRIAAQDDGALDELLAAVRDYFGAKLGLPSAALTFADAAPRLRARGASDGLIDSTRSLFDSLDAGRYASGAGRVESPAELIERARQTLSEAEARLS